MAGQIQKPWHMLQDRRPSRRRQRIILPPPPPRPVGQAPSAGEPRGIDVAIAMINRAFGQVPGQNAADRGQNDRDLEEMLRQAAAGGPRGGKRRYTPRSQRKPNAQRQQLAASRPRDARGHFLPRGAAGTPDEAA